MWNQRHPGKPEFIDVGTNRIDEVLDIVKNVANDLSFEEALIEKSAYLLADLLGVRLLVVQIKGQQF